MSLKMKTTTKQLNLSAQKVVFNPTLQLVTGAVPK